MIHSKKQEVSDQPDERLIGNLSIYFIDIGYLNSTA